MGRSRRTMLDYVATRVSPSGKARASQARIRGFESRHPLHMGLARPPTTEAALNMGRTLSRGKIGPDPKTGGRALPLSPPGRGDLGVSSRRSPMRFSIRRGALAVDDPSPRLGSSRRSTVCLRGWRQAALARGKAGARPVGFGSTAIREGWRHLRHRGGSRHAPSAMRPIARAQQVSSRAVAAFTLLLRTPRARAERSGARRASRPPSPHASSPPGPEPGPAPAPRGATGSCGGAGAGASTPAARIG